MCVRGNNSRVTRFALPLNSLLFHTIHSKSEYCLTEFLSLSLISHHSSLFSPHTQTDTTTNSHTGIYGSNPKPSARTLTAKPSKVRNVDLSIITRCYSATTRTTIILPHPSVVCVELLGEQPSASDGPTCNTP